MNVLPEVIEAIKEEPVVEEVEGKIKAVIDKVSKHDSDEEDNYEDFDSDEEDDEESGVDDGDGIEENEERLSREEFNEQVLEPEGIRPMSQRGIEMWEEYNIGSDIAEES